MGGRGTLYPHRDGCVKISLRLEGDAVKSRRCCSKALVSQLMVASRVIWVPDDGR